MPADVRRITLDEEVELLVIETDAAGYDVASLTDEEAEVATLLADGHDERSVADLRGTSEETVIAQRAAIFDKLGVRTSEELAEKLFG